MEQLTWNQVKAAARKSGRLRAVVNKETQWETLSVQYPDGTLHEGMLFKYDTPERWQQKLAQLKVPVQMELV